MEVLSIILSLFVMSLIYQALAFQRPAGVSPLWKRTSNKLLRHTRSRHRRFLPSSRLGSTLSEQDESFLQQAVEHAKNGFGHTFPNPAVGCVIVRQDTSEILGSGFHPRAGFPHAEVFALLEAAGHVQDGVQAALFVLNEQEGMEQVQKLTEQYAAPNGPEQLFGEVFGDAPVTAYVTLEPCCHYGQTPPCAVSLSLARANRVVVGFRDPNPRVDGGGVQLLESAGVTVDLAEGDARQHCADLVTDFCKRITPRDDWMSSMNGQKRSALRSLAGRRKAESTLATVNWNGASVAVDDNLEAAVAALPLNPTWVERLDAILWKEELVLLRLNGAVGKKKGAKFLGERIAQQLQAHVAQTVGHTCLLYRPGIPAVLDLEQLVSDSRSG